MLKDFPVTTTIRVTDLEKALEFYENKLGLKRLEVKMEDDSLMFEAGEGTKLYIYKGAPTKAEHTLASFDVENIEEIMIELAKNGVTFEIYDLPNIKTDERGIATWGEVKSAWFKDPDGNILALTQSPKD